MDIINIFDFIKKQVIESKQRNLIQEKEFIAKVKEIAPNIVAICICYSHLSQVHLMLEKAGILAKERLQRDIQMVTKGRSISLDETQSKLLYIMAEPDNITKTTIIHGPEGSGKTLLALEVVKMKLSHYLMDHDLTGMKIRNQAKVRVLLCGTYQGEDRVPNLLRQLLSESKDISDCCDLEVQPVKDLKMSSPKEFGKSLKKILENHTKSYIKTIVMMDELYPGFRTEKWKDFKGLPNTDFVLALRHAFNDGVCLGWFRKLTIKEKDFQDIMEQQGVDVLENTVFCHLRKSFRCTQELLSLTYYMLMHSPPEEQLYKQKSFVHLPESVSGKKPLWLQASSLEAFLKYTDTNEDLKDATDVMVIYEPDNIKDVIQKLRAHCLRRKWKVCPSSSVMGSEASIVIIFDMKSVHFESISRAVLQLIFVTTECSK